MLFAARELPTFARSVGVAPATTTIEIPAADMRPAPKRVTATRRAPYTTIEDLKSGLGDSGLGIINETDAWLTGRPYGLPGTAALRLSAQEPYGAAMLGDGAAAAPAPADAMAESLKKIAFWQKVAGVTTIVGTVWFAYSLHRIHRRL